MLVLECGLDALTLDETAFPDTDRHYIYDHLRYRYAGSANSTHLPAVTISVDRMPPVIVGGHKYFRIARELGMESVRAIVTGDEQGNELRAFLRRPDVRIVDNATIVQEMKDTVVSESRHVFFFERPLNSHAKTEFEVRIAGFFRTLNSPLLAGHERRVSHVTYSFGGTCAEFTAVTPVGDECWYADYLRTSVEFSKEVAKIVSYQGGRFVW